jgi:hypothetical protein
MKRSLLLLLTLALTGCAHPYVLKLQNGTRVTTKNKPKLDHGFYVFKDAKGLEARIPQGRVREMEPASMAGNEKDQFKISTPK